MKRITFIFFLLLAVLPTFAQNPEVEVTAAVTADKRLTEFLAPYLVTDEFTGGQYYDQVTRLIVSGPINRDDFDAIYKISTIKFVDLSGAEIDDLPSAAFSFDAGEWFEGNRTLEEVVLPVRIKSIGLAAFSGCMNLKKVNFANLINLERIEREGFMGTALTEVILPGKCTSVDFLSGLGNITTLTTINVDAANPAYESYNGVVYDKVKKNAIFYPIARPAASIEIKAGTDSIGEFTFSRNANITEVILPSSIKTIGFNAFSNTSNLSKVNFPEGLVTIHDGAFENTSLNVMDLPESLKIIGAGAFAGVPTLKTVSVKSKILVINYRAFADCNVLETFDASKTTTLNLISSESFKNCVALKTVDFSNNTNMTEVEMGAFEGCKALETVLLPNSITRIDDRAFADCERLNLATLPSSLTYIGANAFLNNLSLTAINISDKVSTIGNGAFTNCSAVTNLSVSENNPNFVYNEGMIMTADGSSIIFSAANAVATTLALDGIQSLSDAVFAGNQNLTRVTGSNTLLSIGKNAFNGSKKLEVIDLSECINLTSIDEAAFANIPTLKSVILPKDNAALTEFTLGMNAFKNSGIEAVRFPVQTSSLAIGLLENCTKLKTADLSVVTNVNTLPDVFVNCSALETVLLNETGFTSFGTNVFKGCKLLKTIHIPASIKTVKGTMFAYSGLTSFDVAVTHTTLSVNDGILFSKDGKTLIAFPTAKGGVYSIPETTTKVFEFAFHTNSAITTLIIPKTIVAPAYQNIKKSFQGMTALLDFEVAADNAFMYSENGGLYSKDKKTLLSYAGGRTDVTFNSTIENIDSYAFGQNISVKNIVFPATLKTIAYYGFDGASNLESIELPASIKTLSAAFNNCNALRTVTINATVVPSADNYTFYNAHPELVLYVPEASLDGYKANKYWVKYNINPIATSIDAIVNDKQDATVSVTGKVLSLISNKEIVRSDIYNLAGVLVSTSTEKVIDLSTSANQLVLVVVHFADGSKTTVKAMIR